MSLMTIHQSKGLEFSQVHIAGMEENIFINNLYFHKKILKKKKIIIRSYNKSKRQSLYVSL